MLLTVQLVSVVVPPELVYTRPCSNPVTFAANEATLLTPLRFTALPARTANPPVPPATTRDPGSLTKPAVCSDSVAVFR